MANMINNDAEAFKKRIIFEINNSKLPPVITYYIMKDIFHEMSYNYQEVLRREKMQNQKENKQQEQKK